MTIVLHVLQELLSLDITDDTVLKLSFCILRAYTVGLYAPNTLHSSQNIPFKMAEKNKNYRCQTKYLDASLQDQGFIESIVFF